MRQSNLDWRKIQLAKKYYLEGLSPEELDLFLHWKATDADFAHAVNAMDSRGSIREDVRQLGSVDEDVAWEKFAKKNLPTETNPKSRSLASWYRVAAVFVGILACTAVLWMEFSERTAPVTANIPAGNFSNELGRVSTFLLPDSTRVWLSTGSTLHYGENFTTNRKVRLLGEAFFKVKKNPDYPFKIITDVLETRVLGTSFNLRAYPGEGVDLSVYTGKVQFSERETGGGAFFLTKNQSIYWNAQTGFSEVREFDASIAPDWKSGVFRFDDASLEDIVKSLQRWYPVKFEVSGNSGRCRFSGEFHRSSLEQVLEVLSYTLNLSYQINENTVEIKSKPC